MFLITYHVGHCVECLNALSYLVFLWKLEWYYAFLVEEKTDVWDAMDFVHVSKSSKQESYDWNLSLSDSELFCLQMQGN